MSFQVDVPDGTTWDDDGGNEWTAHGDDITVHNPPGWEGVRITVEIEKSVADTWLDVTDDYVNANWSHPTRRMWGQAFTPGTATVVLKNQTTEYMLGDSSGHVDFGRRIRITSHHGDDSQQEFIGRIRSANTPVRDGYFNLTFITARTALATVARALSRIPVTAVGNGDTETERVDRILDSVNFDADDRTFEIGTTEYTASETTDLGGSAIDELNVAALSFLGEILEDVRTGHIRYVSGSKAENYRNAEAVALLRDTDAPWDERPTIHPAEWDWDAAEDAVINYAKTETASGTGVGEYENTDSDDLHGLRPYTREDLIDSSVSATVALRMVGYFAEPIEYPKTAFITDGGWEVVNAILNLDILNRLDLNYSDRWLHLTHAFVSGITYDFRPGRPKDHPDGRTDLWTCTLTLDPLNAAYVSPTEV